MCWPPPTATALWRCRTVGSSATCAPLRTRAARRRLLTSDEGATLAALRLSPFPFELLGDGAEHDRGGAGGGAGGRRATDEQHGSSGILGYGRRDGRPGDSHGGWGRGYRVLGRD